MRKIPNTQRESYEAIKPTLPAKRAEVFKVILNQGEYGATLFELSSIMGLPVNEISGRVTELEKQGLIYESGERRKSPRSDKWARVMVDSFYRKLF